MSFLDSAPDPNRVRALKFFLIATLAVGASASLFTEPNIPTWYDGLKHPAMAPPNYVFAPVWTTLYIVMAVAAWRVWRKTGLRSVEMAAFALQLALNFAWSAIFFGLHQLGAALIEIMALDLVVAATIVLFLRRDKWAGVLLLPYLAWVLFASELTHAFWRLNSVATAN